MILDIILVLLNRMTVNFVISSGFSSQFSGFRFYSCNFLRTIFFQGISVRNGRIYLCSGEFHILFRCFLDFPVTLVFISVASHIIPVLLIFISEVLVLIQMTLDLIPLKKGFLELSRRFQSEVLCFPKMESITSMI